MKDLPFDAYDFFGYIACGLVALAAAQIVCGVPQILGHSLTAIDTAAAFLATYIAGQIIAGPAKWVLEDVVVKRVLGSPTSILLGQRGIQPFRYIFPEYFKPLPKIVLDRIQPLILPLTIDSPGEDIFLTLRYRKLVLSDAPLLGRLASFRDKYGFNRNVSFSMLCMSIAFALTNRLSSKSIPRAYIVLSLSAGVLLFYRYLKFLRQYSYELINQVASSE